MPPQTPHLKTYIAQEEEVVEKEEEDDDDDDEKKMDEHQRNVKRKEKEKGEKIGRIN